jgi:hypothetical protein
MRLWLSIVRSYSPQEWQALSPEEHARIFQARKRSNSYRGGGERSTYGGRSTAGTRNTSAMISHEQQQGGDIITNDDVLAKTSPNTENTIGDRMTRRQRLNAISSSSEESNRNNRLHPPTILLHAVMQNWTPMPTLVVLVTRHTFWNTRNKLSMWLHILMIITDGRDSYSQSRFCL